MSNMSEEMAIEILKDFSKYGLYYNENAKYKTVQAIGTILDLYQKEKEKNKEILAEYKAEQLAELEAKNKSLKKEISLMKSININDNFIKKDKIRAKIEELKDMPVPEDFITTTEAKLCTIVTLENLLEEQEEFEWE